MSDFQIIKEKKGNYKCVIDLHRNLNLDNYGKYKMINAGLIRISHKMLDKLKQAYSYDYY